MPIGIVWNAWGPRPYRVGIDEGDKTGASATLIARDMLTGTMGWILLIIAHPIGVLCWSWARGLSVGLWHSYIRWEICLIFGVKWIAASRCVVILGAGIIGHKSGKDERDYDAHSRYCVLYTVGSHNLSSFPTSMDFRREYGRIRWPHFASPSNWRICYCSEGFVYEI